MNYFVKYKFAIWTVVILSVMVLSIAGTMFYLHLNRPPMQQNDKDERKHQAMQAFWKDLNMTPDQERQMKNLRKAFFQTSQGLFDTMEIKRQLLLNELAKPTPDTVVLYQIADEMGQLQTELKRNAIKHLLNMRAFCNDEQIQKLKMLNDQLIRRDGPPRKRREEQREDRREDQKERPRDMP